MPYPPHPPRKHPHLTVSEARSKHLEPYRFKPGDKPTKFNSPGNKTRTQRELYAEARELAHRAGPGAVRRLAQLAGIPLEEGDDTPRFEDLDPRVAYLAANTLLERAHGKPREYDPNTEPSLQRTDVTKLSPEEREELRIAAEAQLRLSALAAARAAAERAAATGEPAPQADRAGGVVIEGSATLAEAGWSTPDSSES